MSEQEATPKARGSLNESQRAELALFGLDLSAASRRGGSASRNRPSAADWVTLDETQLSTLAPFGSERTFEVGDVFFRAGDTSQDFVVVLQGSVNVSVHDDTTDTSVGRHESGQFLGELGMLLGQRPLVSAVATTSGRALVISPESFSQLMHTLVDLSDIIFREFVARRAVLTAASAPTSVRIIGESGSALSMALRAYAVRSQVPHTWVDITTVSDAAALLERIGVALDDLPVVITPSDVLRRPTTGQLAASLGVAHDEMPDLVHDLIIIGAGPAGLGAAVGGASEGLDTLVLEAVGVGGQAGASSRIENYVGFPNGVRGADLVAAATTQAMRLGARIDAPVQVVALRSDGGQQIVELSDH
ncbi:MAG: cyclic nucleotide-binding domain-containing protein, partial [Actinobacteria bacterium]|nr:cyclic nucleotide-binding domain-containing protein [Actinomycetota bacterium]